MNMIQSAKDQVLALTTAAYQKAAAAGLLPEGVTVTPSVEIPKDTANGDYTTTFCLAAAKAMKMNPRQVAQILTEQMDLTDTYFTSVELAGPGFLNFRLGSRWFGDTVACVEAEGADYGRNDTLTGKKYMVEFVSANPTGPMHMGNARGGVLGDTLASVLQKSGADVWREFYVNDAGNQIDKFARSLDARYQQLIRGEDAVEFPEDGYHGDDIRELARLFYQQEGEKYLDCDEKTRHDALAKFGLDHNIPKMKTDLARYGIQYDAWFFESTLHESGYVADSVKALTQRGYTYEKDGALWLATSRILAENLKKAGKSDEDIEKLGLKDDVLRRANGFYTYFAADIAYHRNKFAVRGFDKVINVWGADHHGHVARLKGAMDALGLDGEHRLDIVLMQLVKLVRDGEVVRMSKRTGKAISLTDLLDEIPVVLQCQAGYPDGVRSGSGRPGGQREPGVLCAVRPRPHLHPAEESGGRGLYRPGRRCRGFQPPDRRDGAGPHQADRLLWSGGAAGGTGLRSQPHQPLPHRSGGGVPQILRRLPHQGRGEAGAAGPAEAGGYHPCGAEERHDPHWLQRPGENVRGPCISNFCGYGRSLHRKGIPCGLAAGAPF